MADLEDVSDRAFAELFNIFSRPIKSPQKAFRTYQLTFKNGEPLGAYELRESSGVGPGDFPRT